MSEVIQEEKKRKGAGGYIAIILLLLIGVGALVWFISKKNGELNDCQTQNFTMKEDMDGMNTMFSEYGIMIQDDIKSNLDEMLAKYDGIQTESQAQRDTIEAKKASIMALKSELENAKLDKKSYARTIYKLRKETVRMVIKRDLVTIDSLYTENTGLKTDLKQTSEQLTQVSDEKRQIEDKANQYEETIKAGSKLQAYGIKSEGIRERNSGSFKETERANFTDQIRACFTVSENNIAAAGNKTIYMQLISPAGKTLYERSSNMLTLDSGSKVVYSDKKVINYQKAAIDVCVFYDLKGEDAEKGNYTIKLYCDGAVIGTDTFVLK